MLAVSNTSPISNLASIGRLELLRSQFSAIWVPGAVAEELMAHPDPFAQNLIQRPIEEQRIKVGKVEYSRLLRLLLLQLHQGEAEAIALATELKADMVLIDEQEGRQLASKTGLAVTGVLGILLHAKRAGTLTAVRPEIDLLRSKAHFFIAAPLEARILSAAKE
jgi:predicted nucleic acid-binding protein